MNDWQDRSEWFKNTFRKYAEDITDVTDWQYLENAALYRKHTGDFDGAIEAMVKAINLTKTISNLSEKTAMNLNYLADLYLRKSATEQAEEALRESIELSRSRYPALLVCNLWSLAGIQNRKGEYREALISVEESRRLAQQQGYSYDVAQAEELIEQIKTNMHLNSAPPGAPAVSPASGRDGSRRDP